ncbi:serine O-acetyltransferase [Methylomonas sp. WSC-7]|uniref:serine O-acetyltransferase n=2 Tax=Methylomonas rosea TaxID=2952227 RepID=A0ABT1TQ68_9GAMM|nr:serine O-acetyltransferase [Methylomonas sp. WSC-7]MCQ8116920.1 serine O-acetyltransferase [Methylomonas sp. WSC-7]
MMFFSPSRPSVASGLWQDWRDDVACVFARDPAARGLPEVLLAYPGVHAVLLHRVTNRLWHADWKLTARLLAAFARWLTNVDIHPGATIGKRFFIDHGAGVVIGETAEIGNDVTMYHGVTLGGTTWNKEKRHPTLGNNVLIGAGAKILGAINLGDNVRVGANSVVIKDVPPCCTVIGIPGRIIQQKGIKIQDPRGIDLDHHLVPDPVGKALSCLVDRLDELENNQKRFVVAEETCGSCEAEGVCHGEDVVVLKQAAGGK